jgi:outer membrane protein TolC
LKKYLLPCSLSIVLLASTLYAESLEEILSPNTQKIFVYESEKNELESSKLMNSWISPLQLQYSKNYTTQFGETIDTSNYSVGIDQPIFRSGGIFYGIKYAKAMRDANRAEIALQKRKMISDAVTIHFNLKRSLLEKQKLHYQIKNDTIDIAQKREQYDSGLLDSSFLDQALLKKSQSEATLLQLKLNMAELEQKFALLSEKDPYKLKLPQLKLMSKEAYQKSNLELQKERSLERQATNDVGVTRAKYLPAFSLQGQYLGGDRNPLFGGDLKEEYYTYGFRISMPLDFNGFKDIEAKKVARLRAATSVIEKRKAVEEEFELITRSLKILDKKIVLVKKDKKVYQNLYALTSKLASAGEKTESDAKVMYNSLQMRQLDEKILYYDKQLQLLKLYSRMHDAL